MRAVSLFNVLLLGTMLTACGMLPQGEQTYPKTEDERDAERFGKVTGEDGIVLFGGRSLPRGSDGGTGIGVNTYLWRASLDALSFMPLSSADPFGGVIITDWYSPPQNPNERVKVTLYVLDRDLRADGVRAAVFRQVLGGAGWQDAAVDPRTGTDLEDAVLTRARQLRITNLNRK
jgi:hypothetical protein